MRQRSNNYIIRTKLHISFFLLFVFSSIGQLSCQRHLSPQALHAIAFFNKADYAAANPRFEALLEKFPKEMLYHYYYGACLLELNLSAEQALFHLDIAKDKIEGQPVHYYIALSYYRQFRFNEALMALELYISTARKQDLKQYEVARLGKQIKLGQLVCSNILNYSLSAKMSIISDSIIEAVAVYSGIGLQNGVPQLPLGSRYLLINTTSDVLFFSAPANGGTSQRDLFKIQRIGENQWTVPEPAGKTVNTPHNEDYPVFIAETNLLYFASNGLNGIGGYDIYKAQYNRENGSLSEPELLPFPINSQWDEFLFLPVKNEYVYVSNRESSPEKAFAYISATIDFSAIKKTERPDEMFVSCFKTAPKELKASYFSKPKTIEQPLKHAVTELSSNSVNSPNIEPVKLSKAEFAMQALELQQKADSLHAETAKLKALLINTTENDARASIFSAIAKNDREALQFQEKANQYYEKRLSESRLSNNARNSEIKTVNQFKNENESPYSENTPFDFDTPVPQGVIYKIQLGAFSKPAAFNRFGGLQPITAEYIQDGKVVKYYVGIFANYSTAETSLRTVKNAGFKEAFIVSYFNGKRVPVERARELEKFNVQ